MSCTLASLQTYCETSTQCLLQYTVSKDVAVDFTALCVKPLLTILFCIPAIDVGGRFEPWVGTKKMTGERDRANYL